MSGRLGALLTAVVVALTPAAFAAGAVASTRKQVSADVTFAWAWTPKHSVITRIEFVLFPRDATIRFHCIGSSCPVTRLKARYHGLRRFRRELVGLKFTPGERLLFSVSAPGLAPERAEFLIRSNGLPAAVPA